MTKKPKISVIMPFFNCEKYLDDSIQSILKQSFRDFEFIIIDDASTDKSDDVVKKYLDDKRIVYIKNAKNKGPVYNFNHGVDIAKADFVARIDGDDIAHIKRLEKQYEYLVRNKLDLIGCNTYLMDEGGKVFSEVKKPVSFSGIKNSLFKFCPILNGCMMGKKHVFKNNKYRQKYVLCNDHDLVFRLVNEGYKLGNLDDFLYFYRIHKGSMLNKFAVKQAVSVFRLKKEMIRKFNLKPAWSDKIVMYLDLISGLFPSRFRLFCIKSFKQLFYHQK